MKSSSHRRTRKIQGILTPPAGTPWALATQMFTSSIGSGVFAAGSAVFFTQYIGLSVTQVALGLSIAGTASFICQVPIGFFVDRLGSRISWMIAMVIQAAGFAAYPLAHTFASFAILTGTVSIAATLGSVARGRYVGDIMPPNLRVRVSAYMRAVLNGGYSFGVLLAGVTLVAKSHTLYLSLPLVNALSYIIDFVLVLRYCPTPQITKVVLRQSRFAAMRDRPFIALTVVNAAIMANYVLLTIVLPLWILERTDAPKIMIPVVFFVNTSMSVFFQVRASRNFDGLIGAARAQRLSGFALAASCIAFSLTLASRRYLTIGLLALGAILLTVGELLEAVGAWGISYALAPDAKRGEYLATYGLGTEFMKMAGPSIIVAIVITHSPAGWIGMAVMFAAFGAAAVPIATWASRTRATAESSQLVVAETGEKL